MISLPVFNYILLGLLGMAVIVFVSLFFITVPYGFSSSKKWGITINPKLGWVLMEFPAPLIFFWFFITADFSHISFKIGLVFLLIWQFHYFYRSFIYPFITNGKKELPLTMVFSGFLFQVINTFIQGYWIYRLAPQNFYDKDYLTSPMFIIGTTIFIVASIINRHSDAVLKNLRKDGSKGYKIPYGGMYRWISSPNYFSEFLIWVGWAFLTGSFAGMLFAIWTFTNLFPRALDKHKWYSENIEGYPKNRKSFFPFIV